MHQYKIVVYKYTPEGAVGELFTTRYADTVEQAKIICAEYENLFQLDEEGNKTNHKMYQIRLFLLCYKLCPDRAAFFAQFEA